MQALSALAPAIAQTFVSLASDIALVIDTHGVIRSVALNADAPTPPNANSWVGQRWVDTVTSTTRPKIEKLLQSPEVARDLDKPDEE